MDDDEAREREILLAAMEELGIDTSHLRTVDGDPFDTDEHSWEQSRLTRAWWWVRWRVRSWSRPIVEPLVRRRVCRMWRRKLLGTRRLRHCCDPWDWRERDHALELHTWREPDGRGPSCDLVLVSPGRRGYRRAVRAWNRGGIAAGRRAWFVWLVPGERWDAELADDAKRRWLRAVLRRDDVELI